MFDSVSVTALLISEYHFLLLCFDVVLTCLGFPGSSDGKESACNVGDLGSNPGLEDPLEKGVATHSSILAGKFHGQRSLVGSCVHGVTKSRTQLNDSYFYLSKKPLYNIFRAILKKYSCKCFL